MSLSLDDVRRIAVLARLKLSPEEEQVFQGQLSAILDYVRQLEELDVSAVEPMTHALGGEPAPLREDRVVPGLPPERALAAAPAREEMQRLRDLHHMHCPKCGLKMTEMKVRGLEVDVCFNCNGVFLDQGDIDVIAAPQQKGIMSAILNWFKDETQHPVK